MCRYLLCCLIFFISYNVYGTHLVGGEMNYRYLGEDLYEIKLVVYRDCYLGEPDFDYPAAILVYSGSGTFMGAFNILGDPKILLPVVIDDECFTAPPNVCVERKEYKFNGVLPLNSEGYYLSYQRCCRNSTILNIFDDKTNNVGDSGLNLFAYVPPRTEMNNSNPVFANFPPIAICVDKPLIVDHRATDADGDSLVYKLCVPTDALSALIPSVNSNNYDKLPFADVRWRNPYSLDNVLGGTEKLKIDSKTGLLTAHPNTVGQFVVGVCVEEYRNGIFISETKRDFQFNVAVCGKYSVSSFFTYDTICNSLNVSFRNESIEADKYRWEFGDGTFSTLKDPAHLFPAYGEYNVTLIASSDNGCADTVSKKIVLKEENFNFSIADVSVCKGDSAVLKIESTGQAVKNVHWLFTPSIYTNKLEHTFLPTSSGEVKFEIYTNGGCVFPGSVNVTVFDKPTADIKVEPDQIVGPQEVTLSTSNNNNYTYLWETKDVNTTPQSYQTTLNCTENQWAYLTVTHKNTGCSVKDSVYLKVDTCDFTGTYSLSKETGYRCHDATFKANATSEITGVTFAWIVDGQLISGNQLVKELNYNETFAYQLVIEQQGFCKDTVSFTESIINPSLTAQKLSTYKLCKEVSSLNVDLGIQSGVDYTVSWGQNTLQNEDSFVIPLNGQNVSIPVSINFNDSCTVYDTVRVEIVDISVEASAQPLTLYKGKETTLTASPQQYESYQWYPENIPASPAEAQTIAVVYETTDFIVVVRDRNGCEATDTIRVEVRDDRCSEENIFIPTAFTPNGDGVNDVWKVRSDVVAEIAVAVYNRWGEKVYESHDITQSWDGSYKGKPAESGSYSYYLTITCENQLQYFNKGNITLMR